MAEIRKTVAPSSLALQEIVVNDRRAKYPWKTMEIGVSFPIYYTEMQKKTLLPYARKMGLKLGRNFKVIDHQDLQRYEIYREPDSASAIETINEQPPLKYDFGFDKHHSTAPVVKPSRIKE